LREKNIRGRMVFSGICCILLCVGLMTACGDTPAGEAAVGSVPASSAVPEEPAPTPQPEPAPEPVPEPKPKPEPKPEVPADAQGHGKLSSGQYWILDKDGVLTITGKGRLNPTNDPWIHYNVKAVVIGEGITSVAEGHSNGITAM